MSRTPLKRLGDRLASPRLAIVLMIVLGVLSFLATLVPQNERGPIELTAWATAHPFAEKLAQAVGFHTAYSSWVFLIPAALLAASTFACAWRRTVVARKRMAAMKRLTASGELPRAEWSIEIPSGHSEGDTLEAAAQALNDLGIKSSLRDGTVVVASTHSWAALASPIFHWTLVLLMVVVTLGQLTRAEGLAGVVVGGSAPLESQTFRVLTAGPLHRWPDPTVAVAVSELQPSYVYDGIDRGPTPTVALVGSDGRTLASQRVYPNAALQHGNLTVHANDYGLAAAFTLLDPQGSVVATTSQLVDFSDDTTSGVAPTVFDLTSQSATGGVEVRFDVPLERIDGVVMRLVPRAPVVEVVLNQAGTGTSLGGADLAPGASVDLPDGYRLRLDALDYYARLSIVQDGSILAIYVLLGVSLVALSAALLLRQRVVVLWAEKCDDESIQLSGVARLWRNAGVTSDELFSAVEDVVHDGELE